MANKYLKFEYWNTCDLGNLYYQGGQHFWFFLDGDVGEPFYAEIEDGQENGDGDFIPTYRRQIKKYLIKSSLVPDYLIDAMKRMELHDHIELTWKTGEVEQIYNVSVEPEWQFEKKCHQATVTITFDMDEKITVGACCENLTVGEVVPPEPIPDLYWVAETGSNISGDGSYNNPWATLAYACTQATTSGDVIHVKTGIIIETTQIVKAVGVSLIGAGNTSIIHSHYTNAAAFPNSLIYTIICSSATGTIDDSSISYLRFDGDNLTAKAAIGITGRSGIKIHHCEFEDFFTCGVVFCGTATFDYSVPANYATGNEFHHNTVINCADFEGAGSGGAARGNLSFGGQQGMLIYDNIITQENRGADSNGFGINTVAYGYNKGCKIYNNTITVPVWDSSSWDFAIELVHCRGGIEIYNNIIEGEIDISALAGSGYADAANDAGGYGFALKIYNNTVGRSTLQTVKAQGIELEYKVSGGVYIYKNWIRNTQYPIYFNAERTEQDVYIYYNLMTDVGVSGGSGSGVGIRFANTSNCMNFNILNNVIRANAVAGTLYGISKPFAGTITNLIIRNNIIVGFDEYCIYFTGCTVNNILIENNDFYGNGHANAVDHSGATVTGDTEQNNITTDPAFVGGSPYDYHLQAGSGCINTGIATGRAFIITDYDEEIISDPPEIGIYEY